MNAKTRVGLLAGAAALTLTGVGSAATAINGQNDDLAQRLAAAEAKIAAMEAAQNQDWLTEQRADEIKGLVQDVLADADTRASLLQAGMTSGYDKGFIIGSSDANWLLRINLLMQQRFIFNTQDDAVGDDNWRYGFENTRSKLKFSGNLVNPSWYYLLDINVGSNGGGLDFGDLFAGFPSGLIADERAGTLNAYIGHDYGNGWKVQIGSMKAPYLREEMVDAEYQLAVERSVTNYLFTTGYADGLMVRYAGENLQLFGMLSDGARSGQSIWSGVDTEFAVTARGEFLLSGNWDQFKDFSSTGDDESGVLLGAAVHYEKGESGEDAVFDGTPSEPELFLITLDGSLEFGGANLFGAFMFSDLSAEPTIDTSPWGIVLQGGFFFTDNWEGFARFEWADFDNPVTDDATIVTLGVNRYFAGHNAKWTTDIGFGINEILVPLDITGYRADSVGSDGQIVLRTQMQILF